MLHVSVFLLRSLFKPVCYSLLMCLSHLEAKAAFSIIYFYNLWLTRVMIIDFMQLRHALYGVHGLDALFKAISYAYCVTDKQCGPFLWFTNFLAI